MSTQPGQQTDFGANEWLVYEIHQQWLEDPTSVPEVWQQHFATAPPNGNGTPNGNAAAPAPAAPAPAAQAQPPDRKSVV